MSPIPGATGNCEAARGGGRGAWSCLESPPPSLHGPAGLLIPQASPRKAAGARLRVGGPLGSGPRAWRQQRGRALGKAAHATCAWP